MLKIAKIAILIIATLGLAANAYAEETYFGYVNCQNLLLLHPLMQQFDLSTKRIKYTSSFPKPSEDLEAYKQRLKDKKAQLEGLMLKLDKEFATKIVGKNMVAQNQRWIFWKKREGLKTQCDLIDTAIDRLAWEGDYYMNMPGISTLFPATKAVTNSVLDALEYLRKKHSVSVILDSSVFVKYENPSIENADLYQQTALKAWNGQSVSKPELLNASQVVFGSITKRFPKLKNKPFLAGAIDLSKEANQLVYNITINE